MIGEIILWIIILSVTLQVLWLILMAVLFGAGAILAGFAVAVAAVVSCGKKVIHWFTVKE